MLVALKSAAREERPGFLNLQAKVQLSWSGGENSFNPRCIRGYKHRKGGRVKRRWQWHKNAWWELVSCRGAT